MSNEQNISIKTTTCYMCACRCGINVHLKDGRIKYIEGNPDHPVNKGVLCAKGSAGIMQHYSPARLTSPLKRVGPRGSGEFEEISWDEFIKLIPSEWTPGLSSPFDPVAARAAKEYDIEVAIINGRKTNELKSYIDGEKFLGTRIHN